MAIEDTVLGILSSLKISDARTIGEILHSKGLYQSEHSARVQGQKALNNLVSLKKLERGDGFYRIPGCESEYGDHAKLLTRALAELFKHAGQIIHREHSIPEVALRPDALVLLKRDGKGLCFILEICHTETPEYLNQKITTWNNWDNSLGYLSNLFNHKIPTFDIVIQGEAPKGCWEFNRYIKEVVNG